MSCIFWKRFLEKLTKNCWSFKFWIRGTMFVQRYKQKVPCNSDQNFKEFCISDFCINPGCREIWTPLLNSSHVNFSCLFVDLSRYSWNRNKLKLDILRLAKLRSHSCRIHWQCWCTRHNRPPLLAWSLHWGCDAWRDRDPEFSLLKNRNWGIKNKVLIPSFWHRLR